VLLIPIWLVVIGLLGLVITRSVAFDRDHLFMLANAYTLWIFLPAYPIAVAAVCFRAVPLATAAGLIVVAHLVWVVPPAFHAVPAPAASALRVRIVSANLRYDNYEHGPLIDELAHSDADVIVLEEVTPGWWRSITDRGLRSEYPVRVTALRDDPGGMAILARRPLTDVVVHHAGGWPVITATLAFGGRRIHLAGVHPVAPLETFARNQRAQREITAIARNLARPRLLVGDFNASPYNRWYHQLLNLGLRDAHESVGRPFATSWPNGQKLLPPLLLDHLFADPPLVAVTAREGRGEGSDHRPIIIDLAVTP
jgi:endonuclease/exonuclease/phosphatase (EEP) superfamily protein YafD